MILRFINASELGSGPMYKILAGFVNTRFNAFFNEFVRRLGCKTRIREELLFETAKKVLIDAEINQGEENA